MYKVCRDCGYDHEFSDRYKICQVCGTEHKHISRTSRTISISCNQLSWFYFFADYDEVDGVVIRFVNSINQIVINQNYKRSNITTIYFTNDDYALNYEQITTNEFFNIEFDEFDYYKIIGNVFDKSVKYIQNRDLL